MLCHDTSVVLKSVVGPGVRIEVECALEDVVTPPRDCSTGLSVAKGVDGLNCPGAAEKEAIKAAVLHRLQDARIRDIMVEEIHVAEDPVDTIPVRTHGIVSRVDTSAVDTALFVVRCLGSTERHSGPVVLGRQVDGGSTTERVADDHGDVAEVVALFDQAIDFSDVVPETLRDDLVCIRDSVPVEGVEVVVDLKRVCPRNGEDADFAVAKELRLGGIVNENFEQGEA
mmetsp:Transcript_21014/g.66009  ORF Transcript_21014/g.66009 Transcript_21014/m.66009 type:complete len:227 (+) Transcript_21014:413-1093(+)